MKVVALKDLKPHKFYKLNEKTGEFEKHQLYSIDDAQIIDAISFEEYNQVRWERDLAESQLEQVLRHDDE